MHLGLTKARSMGPVAEAVEQAGGSVARLFRRTDMPLDLLAAPDRLIPLRDQLRLVEEAVREIGDPALPARLSTATGIAGLGAIGRHVRAATTLGDAIRAAEIKTPQLLQTATWSGLAIEGSRASYVYAVTERVEAGRQTNEILALGYLLGVARHFMGPSWRPDKAVVTGASLSGRADVEAILDCDLTLGPRAGLVFARDSLAARNPAPIGLLSDTGESPIPDGSDLADLVARLILLGLGRKGSGIDWVGRRLGLSRRSFQRRLDDHGLTFSSIRRETLLCEATRLLASPDRAIGEVALDLGYEDPAHFSRAFLDWTGLTPREWRRHRQPDGNPRQERDPASGS